MYQTVENPLPKGFRYRGYIKECIFNFKERVQYYQYVENTRLLVNKVPAPWPTEPRPPNWNSVQEWVDEEFEDWVLVLIHNPRLSFVVANSPINFFYEDFYPPSRIYSQDRVRGGGWEQLLFQYIH